MISIHETSQSRNQAVSEPSSSRIVPKPVPTSQTQDPRKYQLEQLRKRYSPKELVTPDGASSLLFKITPSDPDFPFELAQLECDLRVPHSYPDEKPVLLVKNKDIPRGFGLNIERGWDRLVRERPGATLLAHTRELDKNLESFLSEQKAETIKIVTFKDTRHIEAASSLKEAEPPTPEKPQPKRAESFTYIPEPSYTKEEIAAAKERRRIEVAQLEARMKRTPEYRRSPDGIVYTLPLEPLRRSELPSGLQSVRSLHLIIPLVYPLQSLRVQLNHVDSDDAEPVEDLFCEKAAAQQQMTLMSHMNYLAQNIHKLAKQAKLAKQQAERLAEQERQTKQAEQPKNDPEVPNEPTVGQRRGSRGPFLDSSHVQVIPRPPEWSYQESDGSESSDTDGVVEDEDADDAGGATLDISETAERGTMLSFPFIELHNIEILQVSMLSLSIKCDRCRTAQDVSLQPNVEKTLGCKKCAAAFAVKYRPTLVHQHSSRAGFLDLAGCKVADMLPSTFVPTCARCSTPSLGLQSVRGSAVTNVCRDCHGQFTFKIPDVKFLFITPGSAPPPTGLRRKHEKLGLHAGEQLTNRGTCSHYRKSYRWFRFSCCSRVHPCDRCHDEAEDHINEWANRMICGWCSREQNYAVEACGFCGRSVIGRKGRGFWEGGKGTRDPRMMSRKDPRKYKRVGGSQKAKE